MSTPPFIDWRLSDQVSYGFSGGPRFNTRTTPMRNGYDRRNALWTMPLHEYQADYTLLKEALQSELLHALWVARGSWRAFRFKDWNDYQVSQAEGALAAPATNTSPIQLTKTYSMGPVDTETRFITLPLSAQMFVDGTPFAGFTVDPLTGIVLPTTTWPAGALSWAGEFDVRVHFAEDYNTLSRSRVKTSSASVRIEEVRA